MSNPNYWREAYQDKWKEGNAREDMVTNLLEHRGWKMVKNGFYTGSTQMATVRPNEIGIPDFQIEGTNIFIEVTGTQFMRGTTDIWVRPDKFDYAIRHPDQEVWIAHVIDNLGLFRFFPLKDKVKYQTIRPTIRGKMEIFISIPSDDPAIMAASSFFAYLAERAKVVNEKVVGVL